MDTVRSVWSKLVGSLDAGIPSSSRVTSSDVQPLPLNAGQKKMFEVMLPVVVSTKALDFGPLANEHVQRTIIITNPNRLEFPPVAWKALTNFQHHYCVRPNMGVLKSGDSVTVLLIRETAQRHSDKPPKSRSTPAFLIRSTPILERWYSNGGREQVVMLWKRLTDMQDHLVVNQHKILSNKPETVSPSAIASGALASSPTAELARLRAENALLRAQVSSLSIPSASGSGPGLVHLNTEHPLSTSSTTSRPGGRPTSEYEWEDAAPSYEEAISQESPPRPH